MEEMNIEMMMEEESIFDRLEGLMAEVNQMKAMVEENTRKIAEGDDVEGREFLKSYLEIEILKKTAEIKKLKAQIE